jgi:hypothetical protein
MSSKYDKLAAKGVRGKKAHQQKANEVEAKSAKLQRKLVEPQLLDPARYRAQKNQGQYLPQAANQVGDWLRTGEEDSDLQILKEIQDKGKSEFGYINAPTEKLIDFYKGKKAQEGNMRITRLGAFLIDPKDPSTQARAYEILPDLKNYPEEYHLRNIEIQETIRTWLRDGNISGKDDLILLDHIIRDDFVIETGPLWDPKGLFMSEVQAATGDFFAGLPAAVQRGLWNPRRHGQDAAAKSLEWQRKLKGMLLKRVMPGFREWDLQTIIDWMIKTRTSPVTNDNTDSSYRDWFFGSGKGNQKGIAEPGNGFWNPQYPNYLSENDSSLAASLAKTITPP